MKVAGIIAEYNPFHNGHQYHIEETKKSTGADYVIAIMSGDFVQRGAPAMMDKYDRATCALSAGCDLVLELPVIYSTSSAEFFAEGAVLALDQLGICDFLSFGTELGTLDQLSPLADLLLEEPKEYQIFLRHQLKAGHSFPAARSEAIREYLRKDENCQLSNDFFKELTGSNNILALEYLKSLKKSKSSMVPWTIKRKNAPYHDKKLHESISSATAIREALQKKEDIAKILPSVPEKTGQYLQTWHEKNVLPDFSHLTPYLHGALLNAKELTAYLDWDQELANRMASIPWETSDYTTIVEGLKSRRVTRTRIQRALLHLILQMDKEHFACQYEKNPVPCVRILGFRKESSPLLKAIKKNASLPLITKPASIKSLLDPSDQWVWDMDLKAARLYQSILFQNFGIALPSPYSRSPILFS